MRKTSRLVSLLLAVAGFAAVGAMLLAHRDGPAPVDWVYADETNPVAPPSEAPDGTGGDGGDPNGPGGPGGADDGDGDGRSTPEGGGSVDEPSMGPVPGAEDDEDGGLLGLSLPVQAGMSVGLIALAFLALLPGRRMPEHLR